MAATLPPLCNRHRDAFQVVNEATGRILPLRADGTVGMPVPPAAPPRHAHVQAAPSRRRARHEQLGALRRQGWTGQAMAQQLRLGKTTVWRELRRPTCAERTDTRRGHSLLHPSTDLFLQHWNQGGHDAR